MVIQYLASAIIALILIKLLIRILKDKIEIKSSILWIIFWSAALVILWFPTLLVEAGSILGVGRGVDVLVYISIIILFYLVLNQYTKLEKLDKKLTKIVRELAKDKVNS